MKRLEHPPPALRKSASLIFTPGAVYYGKVNGFTNTTVCFPTPFLSLWGYLRRVIRITITYYRLLDKPPQSVEQRLEYLLGVHEERKNVIE